MAGRPKTRAKREAAAARPAGLAPVAFVDGKAPDTNPVVRDMKGEFLADRRRPVVQYSEEVANEVLIALATGLSLTHLCEMDGMPSRRSIYYWRRDHKEFREAFDTALRFRADGRLNLIDGLIEDVTAGRLDPIAARVALDAHKWLAGKENHKYSDTQKVELTGKDGVPLLDEGTQMREVARWLALAVSQSTKDARAIDVPFESVALPAREGARSGRPCSDCRRHGIGSVHSWGTGWPAAARSAAGVVLRGDLALNVGGEAAKLGRHSGRLWRFTFARDVVKRLGAGFERGGGEMPFRFGERDLHGSGLMMRRRKPRHAVSPWKEKGQIAPAVVSIFKLQHAVEFAEIGAAAISPSDRDTPSAPGAPHKG